MLLKFTVENWMSFRDETTIWMTTDDDLFLDKRVPRIPKYDWRVLPVASIFGGNASGKSNLIEAIEFAKWSVLKGPLEQDLPTGVRPFKLDNFSKDSPTSMNFVVLVDEVVYDYSFSLTGKSIVSEQLVKVKPKSEQIIYERNGTKIDFSKGPLKHDKFINSISQGMRSNQLFLSFIGGMKRVSSWPVYDWFKNSLNVLTPESKSSTDIFADSLFLKKVNEVLPKLDCGIHSIGIKDFLDDFQKPLPKSVKTALERGNKIEIGGTRVVLSERDGELSAKGLVTLHPKSEGNFEPFTVDEESDGTERILDLIPGFLDMSSKTSNKVYIIDEIDRSLHTFMSRHLLEAYFENCTLESRSQLIFSTHDIFLMDKHMLRRDEMFITERLQDGSTVLSSIDDFKYIKTDYELYKDYLSGRFGGIPDIMLGGADFSQGSESDD